MRIAPFAALLLCAVAARSEESVTLARRAAKGDTVSVDEELSIRQKLAVEGRGELEQTTRRVRSGTLVVTKVEDGTPVSVKVTYGTDCAEAVDDASTPSPLAGQTVTVKRLKDGGVSVKCDAALGEGEKAEAAALLEGTPALFPPGEVNAGDSWTADEAALPYAIRGLLAVQAGDRCRVKLALAAVHEADGRTIAEISVSVSLKQEREGVTSKYKLAGKALVDTATGVTVAAELTGDLSVSGKVRVDDGKGGAASLAIEGTGEIRFRSGPRPAGVEGFGRMRIRPPAGWKLTANAHGARIEPTGLPPGGDLAITVIPAIPAPAALVASLRPTWDLICLHLGGDPTNTVDGTPWTVRATQTSFKGWEYLRAEGTVRRAGSDIEVDLLLVRVNGRVERLYVTSLAHSWKRDRSTYSDPRYRGQVQKILFGIEFDDWKDPPRPAGSVRGEGVVGVWTGISMRNSQVVGGYLVLLSNGQAWYASKFPFSGLADLDTWVDAELYPREWGSWTFKDGAGVVTMKFEAMPIRLVGDDLVLTSLKTDHKYTRIPSIDGARFEGTWFLPDQPGRPDPTIAFTADGRFTDAGVVTVLNHDYGIEIAPGSGTYRVADHTLVLRFDDGREHRFAFPGWGLEKGISRPAKLVLTFNEDTLTRK